MAHPKYPLNSYQKLAEYLYKLRTGKRKEKNKKPFNDLNKATRTKYKYAAWLAMEHLDNTLHKLKRNN